MSESVMGHKAFKSQLKKYYSFYTGGFIVFLLALAVAEQMGMSRQWIGYWFLLGTIGLYAGIGIMSRTVDRRRILRRGTARAGILQRHGDRRRLDERGFVHRHGRARCTWRASTASRS